MKPKQFSFRARINSIQYAWEGICQFFRQEHNARIHLVATVLVFSTAWVLALSRSEIILLVIVTGCVWVAEIFNTVIEKIMDRLSPGRHAEVKVIKDLAAAAVLVAACMAFATGAFIFIPKLF
jgi:diacylglycerol kinase (ATP)